MTGKESPRPEQSGTQWPLRQALAATVLFLALLAGVVAAGAGLSGNWSVSTAWNRAVAAVTARPEYRVALSLFEDGGSAEFARELLEAVTQVLRESLAAGGTSFDALYVNVLGESGYFERSLNAYGRAGEPCHRCAEAGRTSLIVREPFQNRSSYRCPHCQRAPRSR